MLRRKAYRALFFNKHIKFSSSSSSSHLSDVLVNYIKPLDKSKKISISNDEKNIFSSI